MQANAGIVFLLRFGGLDDSSRTNVRKLYIDQLSQSIKHSFFFFPPYYISRVSCALSLPGSSWEVRQKHKSSNTQSLAMTSPESLEEYQYHSTSTFYFALWVCLTITCECLVPLLSS